MSGQKIFACIGLSLKQSSMKGIPCLGADLDLPENLRSALKEILEGTFISACDLHMEIQFKESRKALKYLISL